MITNSGVNADVTAFISVFKTSYSESLIIKEACFDISKVDNKNMLKQGDIIHG